MKNGITANDFHTQDELCPMAKASKLSRYRSCDVSNFLQTSRGAFIALSRQLHVQS